MINASRLRNVWQRCVPGMSSGTLYVRASGATEDTFTAYAMTKLKLKRLTKEDIQTLIGYPSNLAYLVKRSRTCQVWKEHLDAAGAPIPKVDDYFLVGSVTWVVKSVSHKLLDEVVNCLVERE